VCACESWLRKRRWARATRLFCCLFGAKKQGKNLEKLEKILEKLVCREELPKFHYVRHMMMLSQCTLRRQPW